MGHALDPPGMSAHALTARAAAVAEPAALAQRALDVAYRAALGVVGDPHAAQDVAQEVAIKALTHAARLRDPACADAWLYRVATRAALREVRRSAGRRRAEQRAHAVPPAPAPSGELTELWSVLAGLPPRQRAVLTLRYVFDLSDRDIAAAVGCREATVRSHLFHGRATLRARLDPHGDATS